jgi:hypothetical protein
VIVALVSDNGLPAASVEAATVVVGRVIGGAAGSGLTPSATIASMESGLSAHMADAKPKGETTTRLLGIQELRLNQGDIASARVGQPRRSVRVQPGSA